MFKNSDKVQITTATCLKLIVSYWPDAILRKHYQHITSLIENGIRAPRSEVRSFMRESQEIIRRKFSNLPEEWVGFFVSSFLEFPLKNLRIILRPAKSFLQVLQLLSSLFNLLFEIQQLPAV